MTSAWSNSSPMPAVPARRNASPYLTVAAVLFSGGAASIAVSAYFLIPTAIVAWMLAGASRRSLARGRGGEFADLAEPLRSEVIDTLARLVEGDARSLLLGVVAQARPILAATDMGLDEKSEAETRANVVALVNACCSIAVQLAELDRAVAAQSTPPAPEWAAKLTNARTLMTKRLTDASSSLTSLYLAGIGEGSPAATRVGELVSEITLDASGRSAASSELHSLLDT